MKCALPPQDARAMLLAQGSVRSRRHQGRVWGHAQSGVGWGQKVSFGRRWLVPRSQSPSWRVGGSRAYRRVWVSVASGGVGGRSRRPPPQKHKTYKRGTRGPNLSPSILSLRSSSAGGGECWWRRWGSVGCPPPHGSSGAAADTHAAGQQGRWWQGSPATIPQGTGDCPPGAGSWRGGLCLRGAGRGAPAHRQRAVQLPACQRAGVGFGRRARGWVQRQPTRRYPLGRGTCGSSGRPAASSGTPCARLETGP
mmetsp:Transcript_101417/g.175159  ORF Transcript_101417/g.175159 Transcript_101417/m.175159 type:complete len:252 (-) Transcript_101417:403-1158(-)